MEISKEDEQDELDAIDQSEFEAKLEVTLIEAEKWWEELEDEKKAEFFLMKKDGKS